MSESPRSIPNILSSLTAAVNGFVPHPNDKMCHEDIARLEAELTRLRRVEELAAKALAALEDDGQLWLTGTALLRAALDTSNVASRAEA